MRFLKNIGPQWFNRFDGYCPQKKQRDKPSINKQYDIYMLRVGILVMTEISVLHLLE